jgi:hypothetical protein
VGRRSEGRHDLGAAHKNIMESRIPEPEFSGPDH